MIFLKKFSLTLMAIFLLGLVSIKAQNELWYIPVDVGASSTPMLFVDPGTQGAGYALAGDQECASAIADSNPFCKTDDWDLLCQEQYNDCVFGSNCPGLTGDWYLPDVVGSAPIVYACSAPDGYSLADQTCAQQIVTSDPFCTSANWDGICSRAYNCCRGVEGCASPSACNYDPTLCPNNDLCVFPEVYIPVVIGSGPAVIDCTRPTDYMLAPSQECALEIIDGDDFCTSANWDGICNNAYSCCFNAGCTDSDACNYDEDACASDDSCVFGGCTYPDAINYDSTAACDDGSCLYDIAVGGCLGDLDGNYAVNSADLTLFLSVFGTTCPIPLAD